MMRPYITAHVNRNMVTTFLPVQTPEFVKLVPHVTKYIFLSKKQSNFVVGIFI